jgi:hypothetical protein
MSDAWETVHFGGIARDGRGDADNDGLADVDEFRAGTDPARADTDGDGVSDAREVASALDPTDAADAAADPDGDGVQNARELELGLDPAVPDVGAARVQFAVRTTSVSEADGTAMVSVVLSALPPHTDSVTAVIEVTGGTATRNVDYAVQTPITLSFDRDHLLRHVTVQLIADDAFEPREVVQLRLVRVLGALPGAVCEHRVVIADALSTDRDSDRDGLPDAWELKYFGDLRYNGLDDPDHDGESNRREYLLGRHPNASARQDVNNQLRLNISGVVR